MTHSPTLLMEVPFLLVIVCMGTTVLASLGCGLIKYVATKRSVLLDVPNERSAHSQPMPRGGGGPMAVAALLAIALIGFVRPELLAKPWIMSLCLGGGAIALLGWLDDCFSLPVLPRFLVHLGASAWAVWWLCPPETTPGMRLALTLWVAWSINYYNFMDGLDGLAGSEAVFVGLAGGYIAGRLGLLGPMTVAWIIAAAALGFLFWNWPPAKVFLGDAGSGFLGYAFGCISIAGGMHFAAGFGTWVILLALFWLDATITLLRRIIRGEKFWQAHREHFYQQAVQRGYSHLTVVLVFIMVNMLLFIWAATWAGIGLGRG